jgi:hypothetical protein
MAKMISNYSDFLGFSIHKTVKYLASILLKVEVIYNAIEGLSIDGKLYYRV